MTPDPRTEEIRAHYAYPYVATSPGEHDRVAYLLDRNKALEDVADAARAVCRELNLNGTVSITSCIALDAALANAGIESLDGQS